MVTTRFEFPLRHYRNCSSMLVTLYLIEEFVGNTRCLILSKTHQVADRIDELTQAWDSGQPHSAQ